MNEITATDQKRVLVVDDEPAILVVVKTILRLGGYAIDTAPDGTAGLSRFEEGNWDLIITDRAMPGLNGEELAEQIKASSPEIPVIMITGFGHLVARRDLFAAVVLKPFTHTQLLEAVAAALSSTGQPPSSGK